MAHSSDGAWFWNGEAWVPAWSPDRRWWWDGRAWIAVGPPTAVHYGYEPTVWTRRLQLIIVAATLAGAAVGVLVIPAIMNTWFQRVIDSALASQRPGSGIDPEQMRQTMTTIMYGGLTIGAMSGLATYAVLLVGIWKLWRWVYWYYIVVYLLAVLAIPQDILYVAGIGPFRLPLTVVLPGMLLSLLDLGLAVWMVVLYRRYGTWARRRVPLSAEATT